jgi:predicted nucleic-acid-binding protein
MRIAADTNVLLRLAIRDDSAQTRAAQKMLSEAALIAVTNAALCEFVWVLSRGYRIPRADVAMAIRILIASANVVANDPAVEAGLSHLEQGGDFADGVIAYEGAALGADAFVSFDKAAVKRLQQAGVKATLLP